jgi:hypothetical protein
MIKVTMKSLVDDFGYYFKKYGITQKQLKDSYEKDQSIGDHAWSIFQKILTEIAIAYQNSKISLQDFYNKTSDTYQQMAYLLKLEKKDSRKIQSLQFENEVKYMELAYSDLIGVKILSYGCCDGCHPFNNRILTIEEALEFAKTTETRCQPRFEKSSRCTLVPEIKEDENSPIKLTVTFGH